jgi:hypothetical protein
MVSTSFDRLKTLPPLNFYQGAKRKILVLISDMETEAFGARELAQVFAAHRISLLLVRTGSHRDRVWWRTGGNDPSYRTICSGDRAVAALARLSAGHRLYETGDAADVAARVRALADDGRLVQDGISRRYVLLAPFLLVRI